MNTVHGGKRQGAGRKRKALAEKLETKRGQREARHIPPEAMSEIEGADIPPPSDWLKDQTKNTQRDSVAGGIYESTWRWITERKCGHLITREQIEQYAASVARYIQCEEGLSTFGLLAKHPTTNMPIASPYVAMSEKFLRRANQLWATIFQIVKENCETPVGANPNEDIMERILTGKL